MREDLTNNNSMPDGAAIEPLEREPRLYERVVTRSWILFRPERGSPDSACRQSVSYRKPLVLAAL